ncbi:MAG TPA: hypothetical protein VHF22_09755, partial [Planctomycetota bacterium]|nr:hypothetical protein [Planctomycetota bacterium]
MILGGRYEVLRTLGEGASGVVYLARELPDGRPVALKILKHSASPRPPAAAPSAAWIAPPRVSAGSGWSLPRARGEARGEPN